ncbi:YihY family inner membrane protein [Pseudorhodoferax sp.]|uniref:YihY family inner membrane protein n=1 Tax=Pseudorhodoferax sp. TaxID=1993553 RepID=UPI002DD6B8C8|nr:YihY family inner membrane protein [Pseudorhodoferax sp.]
MFSFRLLRRHAVLRALVSLARDLRHWPWRQTLAGLRVRFDELRLGQTAGSLTFTTLISLVPLLVLSLALFTAFPMFASFQKALEQYFLSNLVPDGIARPVLRTLTQFAGKARGIGTVGALLLAFTALALMLTMDRTFNAIWRVRRPRPFAQRVLVYWATLTLGPLALGASLAITSYLISAGQGLVERLPGGMENLLEAVQFAVLTGLVAGLYHFVPNTHVRWRHALMGGVFVAAMFVLAKAGLAFWLKQVPTYATLYGAFATLPVFLIWIYLGWVIVLLGALLAANAPGLTQGLLQRAPQPGLELELALGAVQVLWQRQARGAAGVSKRLLAQQLRVDPLQLEPVLEALQRLDLVGRLEEEGAERLVLLRNPYETPAAPLLHALVAMDTPASRGLWAASGWQSLRLAQLLAVSDRRAAGWL